jgi:hypothetical protein
MQPQALVDQAAPELALVPADIWAACNPPSGVL